MIYFVTVKDNLILPVLYRGPGMRQRRNTGPPIIASKQRPK